MGAFQHYGPLRGQAGGRLREADHDQRGHGPRARLLVDGPHGPAVGPRLLRLRLRGQRLRRRRRRHGALRRRRRRRGQPERLPLRDGDAVHRAGLRDGSRRVPRGLRGRAVAHGGARLRRAGVPRAPLRHRRADRRGRRRDVRRGARRRPGPLPEPPGLLPRSGRDGGGARGRLRRRREPRRLGAPRAGPLPV